MKYPASLLATAPLDDLSSIDITDGSFKANPFPFYARLRTEAPVFPVRVRRGQRAWLVTRYDDVLDVLKNDELFVKNRRNAMTPEQLRQTPGIPAMFAALERNLLGLDGGDHDRLKALVHKAFTPRMIERMRDHTHTVTHKVLDAAEKKGTIDLITDFALPVPLTIIGRILGIPEADLPRFGRWTKAFISLGTGRNPLFLLPAFMAFMNYLRRLITWRRKQPQDDLISDLVRAQEGNDQLTDDEVLALIFLLLSAGHETTVNLISSGILALIESQEQLQLLRTEPHLIKPAIEELVRYVVPAEMATERYAKTEVTIANTRIPKGEMILAVIASANRDPAHFENPDLLDLTRPNNKHLSFGQGMHYCLGAPLSRMEAQIAIGALVQRAPNLRLCVPAAQLRWQSGLVVRGLESLPMVF